MTDLLTERVILLAALVATVLLIALAFAAVRERR